MSTFDKEFPSLKDKDVNIYTVAACCLDRERVRQAIEKAAEEFHDDPGDGGGPQLNALVEDYIVGLLRELGLDEKEATGDEEGTDG